MPKDTDQPVSILIIDDTPAIHEDYRKILTPDSLESIEFDELAGELFGSDSPVEPKTKFRLDSAMQGQEGLAYVEDALRDGWRYALAFVDMRMPPGWDGVETIRRIWAVDPQLQIVVCTAYSDHSWANMAAELGVTDRLMILKKPFDSIEVLQMAHALAAKWRYAKAATLKMEEMERMVEERTTDLEEARQTAEKASRAKSLFLANMSHEIRTPLNGVLGTCDLLLHSDLDDSQRDLAETLRTSGSVLLSLLNDVLDLTKIEAGKLDLDQEMASLESLAEEVSVVLSRQAIDKGLELVLDLDPRLREMVRIDATRLRQVILNLAGNAIKFTTAGEVVIQLQLCDRNESEVRVAFSVRDTGIGVAPEIQEKLFKSFIQADSSITRRFGGTGLGLVISQSIIQLMGGKIEVESEPDVGSTFRFELTLPFAEVGQQTPPVSTCAKNWKVLLVEDNASARKAVKQTLESIGAIVDEAQSFDEAKAYATQADAADTFDWILVDATLPEEGAAELIDAIVSMEGPHSRIILMASPGAKDDPSRLDELMVDGKLSKPIRPSLLKTFLENQSESRNARKGEALENKQRPVDTALSDSSVRARVLLAEDNIVNQKIAAIQLKRLGLAVDIAANGIEAVKLATRTPYDIIFMDGQMPEMDGLEAARRIREDEKQAHKSSVPIIALTAGVAVEEKENCMAAGMNGYCSKPIRWEAVAECVDSLLIEAGTKLTAAS